MKIQFRAGKFSNCVHILPYIYIVRSCDATDWRRFSIQLGFWSWGVGWLFAIKPYCSECGAYFKEECFCDDDCDDE